MTRRVITVLLPLLLALQAVTGIPAGHAASSAPDHSHASGTLEEFTYQGTWGTNPYLVYTPASYARSRTPAPVVMMIHGCSATAMEQAQASAWHAVAERERFIVVYPDNTNEAAHTHDGVGSHPGQCWRWYDPASNRRGSGDPAQLAGITREVSARWNVDEQRVYAVGMSSGAMMTSILGATYPDLYAAIGVVAGCAYLATACLGQEAHSEVESSEAQARAAYVAMGEHARVVPMIEMHGDRDTTVPPAEGRNAVRQWLMTNNLVLSGDPAGPLQLTPASSSSGTTDGGYTYDVDRYADADGCQVSEHWRIRDMGHYWPGGSADPAWAEWTDWRAPSGAEATWAFLSRFDLSPVPDCRAGAGRHWVSTWYGAPHNSTTTARDQSYRMLVNTALGGSRVRARFSNVHGQDPLVLRSANLALPVTGAQGPGLDPTTAAALTFRGDREVVVPPGEEVRSDPVDFDVPPDANVAVSFHVAGTMGRVTMHRLGLTTSYTTPPDAGDHAEDAEGTAFTRPTTSWSFVTGLEVVAPRTTSTVVALGDSITDGAMQVPNSNGRWPDLLNDRIAASSLAGDRVVVNAGISGNMVTADRDGTALQGEAAWKRLERDVLDQPGLSHVILFVGINDVGQNVPATDIIEGYRRIADRLRERGVTVVGATMTPAYGHVAFGTAYTTNDAARVAANEWLRESSSFDTVVDFSNAVATPTTPETWRADHTYDLLHPNPAGLRVLADSVPLTALE